MLDATSMKWGNKLISSNLPKYKFRGTIKVEISQPNLQIEAKNVLVTVNWSDSTPSFQGKQRKYKPAERKQPSIGFGLKRQ